MKTVRFSQVVAACGRPEVYLLFDPDDSDFRKALKAQRVMTVAEKRAATSYGTVGYDAKQHGQLLLFPKSLKAFAEVRVVGIKFDLLAEPPAEKHTATRDQKTATRPGKKKALRVEKKPAAATTEQPKPAKVIAFPKPEPDEDEDPRVEKLKQIARKALAAVTRRHLREAERALADLLDL